VGHFVYGSPATSIELDDRLLAHVKMVIAAKLRRGEGFMFTWEYATASGSGHSSVWLHPSIPLQFDFEGATEPTINRVWLEELMRSSNSASGLRALLEPAPADDAASLPPAALSTARVARVPRSKLPGRKPVA
jgi:hypothetical protein